MATAAAGYEIVTTNEYRQRESVRRKSHRNRERSRARYGKNTAASPKQPKHRGVRRDYSRIEKFLFTSLLLLALLCLPLNLSNPYLRSSSFEKVTARSGENTLAIAQRYTADQSQQEELAAAIAEINGLPPRAPLPANRRVIVPLLK